MKSRRFIKLSRLLGNSSLAEPALNSSAPVDWVTIGVLYSKSSPRTTSKGGKYCVLRLSDLAMGTEGANLFLFDKVFERWWKELIPGMVIAVLNGKVLRGETV